jgi:capsular exopolysaccharide synthesis family protein
MSRIEDALNLAANGDELAKASSTTDLPSKGRKELSLLSSVRTNLLFAMAGIHNPVVMACSTLPGEGVSTILYYLSQLLSAEKKTLLVDANFRNPKMHDLFGVNNQRGLSDLFLEKCEMEDCIQSVHAPSLDLLPSGPSASAAHWFLGASVARKFIVKCKSRYDIVLIDAPPLRESPDTAVLGSYTDGVVLVVRARKTKRDLLRYAQGLLDNAGARQVGVVLNRMKYWLPGFLYERL